MRMVSGDVEVYVRGNRDDALYKRIENQDRIKYAVGQKDVLNVETVHYHKPLYHTVVNPVPSNYFLYTSGDGYCS